MSRPLVHGMSGGLEEPAWPPLEQSEVRGLLRSYPLPARDVREAAVVWHSPRPMSAAALVRAGTRPLFVKRHSLRVRDAGMLHAEHSYADHLRASGIATPSVLETRDGGRVVQRGDAVYEVHDALSGDDLYRDAMSWTAYRSRPHAVAAGRALAEMHRAAEGFDAPARPFGPLSDGCFLACSDDPLGALQDLVGQRPAMLRYLSGRRWRDETGTALAKWYDRLADGGGVRTRPPLWTHGDWHPSNLAWKSDRVAGVFDFGLSNRTFALHDLAVAVERACIDWLDPAGPAVQRESLEGLLEGYTRSQPADLRLLSLLLPVVHVEYALSEVEYFAGVTGSATDASLAYDGYLLGHAEWFATSAGRELLEKMTAWMPAS